MNRYLAYSGGVHAFLFLLIFLVMLPAGKKPSATYTIDFIGSGKVVATTGQEAKAPAPAQKPKAPEVKAPAVTDTASQQPAAKPVKKAYASKSEISAKKQAVKKQPAPAPLAAPSILEEGEGGKDDSLQASKEGEFQGGNIQTDFANFPYPWYITQVRNSLWIEWEKRRPVGTVRGTMGSFASAREIGKIGLNIPALCYPRL